MICHSIILNVDTGTWDRAVEIPQGDGNAHSILLRLVSNKGPLNLTGFTSSVKFYRSEDGKSFDTMNTSKVVNGYRGYVSYLVGHNLTEFTGRLVGEVTLLDDINCRQFSAKFIVNIVLDANKAEDSSVEVIITKEFYDSLVSHLGDESLHLSAEDHDLLDFVAENRDAFITSHNLAHAIKKDHEVYVYMKGIAQKVLNDAIGDYDFEDMRKKVEAHQEALTWDYSLL